MAYLREGGVLLVFGETGEREVLLEGVVEELAHGRVDGSFYLLDVLVDQVFLDEDQVSDLFLLPHHRVVHVHRLRVSWLVIVRQDLPGRPCDPRSSLVLLRRMCRHSRAVFLCGHLLARLRQVYVRQSRRQRRLAAVSHYLTRWSAFTLLISNLIYLLILIAVTDYNLFSSHHLLLGSKIIHY